MTLAETDDRLGGLQAIGRKARDQNIGALIGQRQMDVATPLEPQPLEQPRSGATSAKSSGAVDMALDDIDDGVALLLRKADQDAAALGFGMEGRAAAAAWRREMRRPQRRRQPLRVEGGGDPVGDEARIAFIVEMLELASATAREMTAGRRLMVRARHDGAVGGQGVAGGGKCGMTPVFGHAVATRGDADNDIAHGDQPLTAESASAKSSAMNARPQRRAARP